MVKRKGSQSQKGRSRLRKIQTAMDALMESARSDYVMDVNLEREEGGSFESCAIEVKDVMKSCSLEEDSPSFPVSKEEDWPSSPVRIEKDLDSGETMSISHAPKQAEKDTGKLVRMVITELVESVKTVTANVAWEIVMLSWNS